MNRFGLCAGGVGMDSNDSSEKIKERIRAQGESVGAEEKVQKKFLDYFKKNESKISFGAQIEKIYDLLSSKSLNKQDKALVIGALIYFINPFDIMPDITPFVGFLDDMSVIALVYRYLSNRSLEVGDVSKDEDGSQSKK